jgi:T5orf172 domain
MHGIIYVLTNEAMPGLVKIGLTTDSVESRIANLSATSGVPLPFECHFAAQIPEEVNLAKLEKTLHQLFADHRINPKREFFKVEPEKVVLALSIGGFKEVTPGKADIDPVEVQALEKAKEQRRSRINLAALGINPGDTLVLSRDEDVTVTVLAGGKVSYKGEVLSLSAAALKALQAMGYKATSVSGSDYWMFEGELLDERRIRLEATKFEGAVTEQSHT